MSYAIVTVVVLILDQLMKFWTTKNIPLDALGDACAELIPGVVHLTNVHNYGAAFSIMQNARWLLVIITAAFAVLVVVLITQEIIRGSLGKWTAVLVMAGALSNGLDRALYGYVVDMFELEFVNFAVFNIADIFITVFGILFCVYILLQKPEPGTEPVSAHRKSRGAERKKAELSHEDEAEEAYEAESEETGEERLSRSERRRMRAEAMEAIPKRGEHKNLQEEFAPSDPDNPFAEWGEELGFETAETAKVPAADELAEEAFTAAPAEQVPAEEKTEEKKSGELSFDDELSFDLDDILSEFDKDV